MAWQAEFAEITAKTHTEQGIWWLNGFWLDGAEAYKEDIWTMVHQFIEVQTGDKKRYGKRMQDIKEDPDLDEFKSHRILEVMGEVLTVIALRKRLKEMDIDNNKRMSITEYMLSKYEKKPEEVVNCPQGEVEPEKLAAAQAACNAASDALAKSADEAEQAAKAQTAAEAALVSSEAAEAAVKAAEVELQASVDEITALEEAKAKLLEKYQKVIDDPAAGAVKKGRAVSEKEQCLSEDPLPLRKAKITQGAALKRVQKARKVAEQETAKSAAAAVAAAQAREEADAAKIVADTALAEAMAQLDDIKKKGGTPLGQIWWMERELAEKQKFM